MQTELTPHTGASPVTGPHTVGALTPPAADVSGLGFSLSSASLCRPQQETLCSGGRAGAWSSRLFFPQTRSRP